MEHVIGKVEIFKILSDRYRNRRKISGLRFNLIAGIYNFELKGKKTFERGLMSIEKLAEILVRQEIVDGAELEKIIRIKNQRPL